VNIYDLKEERTPSEFLAQSRIKELWQPGDLFYNFFRFPTKGTSPHIDRLPLVFKNGLIPPVYDTQGEVYTDVGIRYPDVPRFYRSLIFLHKFQDGSAKYIPSSWEDKINQRVCFLVSPDIKLLTQEEMGEHWPVWTEDEVYYSGIIKPNKFIGVVVPPYLAFLIKNEFQHELLRLAIPLYDTNGKVYWPG
jgi:hypothetical protein